MSFATYPLEDSVSRLTRLLDQYRPDVVVTYTGLDGRNHPDHLQAHRITVEAVEADWDPGQALLRRSTSSSLGNDA